jgi:superfamily II DNA or RNA helicase
MNKYRGLIWTNTDYRKELVAKGDGPNSTTFDVHCWREEGNDEFKYGIPRVFGESKGLKFAANEVWRSFPIFNGTFRDGQRDAIEGISENLLQSNTGITELHTGFGKSIVSLSVAQKLNAPVLVVCHKEDLLYQFARTAKDFWGIEAGWVQGPRCDYKNRLVTVATVNTLALKADELPEDFWDSFGMVVADEGHRFPGNMFQEVFSRLSAKYRLGMSATFRRGDNLNQIWEWHLGKLIYTNGMKGQAGKFYQPRVGNFGINERNFTFRGTLNTSRLLSAIAELKELNLKIASNAIKLSSSGRQVLIISDRTEQLHEISGYLPEGSFGFYVASLTTGWKSRGSKKIPIKRTVKKQELDETKSKKIILASYGKIAEGSDIPSLDTVILCTPRKDVEQVIGRIQRQHPNKKYPLVIDPTLTTSYNIALSNCRRRIYDKLGFTELRGLPND